MGLEMFLFDASRFRSRRLRLMNLIQATRPTIQNNVKRRGTANLPMPYYEEPPSWDPENALPFPYLATFPLHSNYAICKASTQSSPQKAERLAKQCRRRAREMPLLRWLPKVGGREVAVIAPIAILPCSRKRTTTTGRKNSTLSSATGRSLCDRIMILCVR